MFKFRNKYARMKMFNSPANMKRLWGSVILIYRRWVYAGRVLLPAVVQTASRAVLLVPATPAGSWRDKLLEIGGIRARLK